MRSLTRWGILGLAVVVLSGCRDEQAGPKPKTVKLEAPRVTDRAPERLTYRSGASFADGAVLYLGSDVAPLRPEPGGKVMLRHWFQAVKPPPAGYQFFVHLVDADSGVMLMNADHDIQGGALPMTSWPVGKVVEDVHTFDLPAPRTRVLLGFWRGEERLAVDDAAAHDGQNRMFGPLLEARSEQLPRYTAVRAAKPPVIDGALDDAVWQKATPVKLVGSYDGRTPALATTLRLAYDDTNLYAAFDIEDPDVWGTLKNRDDPIYNEEVVELFLDANGDGKTYNELQVSPNNVLFDAYFPARRQGMDLTFDSQMKTAVKVDGTVNSPGDRDAGWRVELQVPMGRLHSVPNLPPKPSDVWRFNAYRLEHLRRRDIEGQAFSPLFVGDFHALPRFGELVFQP